MILAPQSEDLWEDMMRGMSAMMGGMERMPLESLATTLRAYSASIADTLEAIAPGNPLEQEIAANFNKSLLMLDQAIQHGPLKRAGSK